MVDIDRDGDFVATRSTEMKVGHTLKCFRVIFDVEECVTIE